MNELAYFTRKCLTTYQSGFHDPAKEIRKENGLSNSLYPNGLFDEVHHPKFYAPLLC